MFRFLRKIRYQWSLDKVTLTDGYGKTMSFCQVHPLPSGMPIKFKFKAEDCVAKSALSHEYAFSTGNKMVCFGNMIFPHGIINFIPANRIIYG